MGTHLVDSLTQTMQAAPKTDPKKVVVIEDGEDDVKRRKTTPQATSKTDPKKVVFIDLTED